MDTVYYNTILLGPNLASTGDANIQRAIDFLVAFPRLTKICLFVQQPGNVDVLLRSTLGLSTRVRRKIIV